MQINTGCRGIKVRPPGEVLVHIVRDKRPFFRGEQGRSRDSQFRKYGVVPARSTGPELPCDDGWRRIPVFLSVLLHRPDFSNKDIVGEF
jgi:hypothetical protein